MTDRPVTQALEKAGRGEPGAADQLWELVYADLRRLAAARIGKLRPGQTLQATALVSEVWVRLGADNSWQNRAHFFGAAARSMRNILVDAARSRQRLKRNSGEAHVTLATELSIDDGLPPIDVLALDEALERLSTRYERPAQIVMLRFFAGQSTEEIAGMLGVTKRTIEREFLFARTWLRKELTDSVQPDT